MASESLYERLGGDSVINVAVDIFYQKILADPYISVFFKNVNMTKQIKKQKSFLKKILGGPHSSSGQNMREIHKHLVENMGLNDSHFDQLQSHLRSTLALVGIEQDFISETIAVTELFRDEVLNK